MERLSGGLDRTETREVKVDEQRLVVGYALECLDSRIDTSFVVRGDVHLGFFCKQGFDSLCFRLEMAS